MRKMDTKNVKTLIRKLEWSATREGPGLGPHDSGKGTPYRACPICGQLEKSNGEFIASAVGHKRECLMKKVIKELEL